MKKQKQVMSTVENPQAAIVGQKTVYDFRDLGKFMMDELRIKAELHEGGSHELTRILFNRGHSVAMLPYDPDRDEVVLVSEMRPGMLAAGEYPYDAQVSAGMIDKGETAEQAGRREGREELNASFKLFKIFNEGAYVSPGGTSEKIALGFAIVDTTNIVNGSVHGEIKEGENIKTIVMPAKKFIENAEKGAIKDMKTLTCAFWLALNREKLQKEYGRPKPRVYMDL